MKRLISTMMAAVLLTLTLSTGLTAMATNEGGSDDQSAAVYYQFVQDEDALAVVYDIVVGNLPNFVYKRVTKQVWDNDTHSIRTVLDEQKTGWTSESEDLTITNNSTVGISVSVSYSADIEQYTFDVTNGSVEILDPSDSKTVTVKPTFTPGFGDPSELTQVGEVMFWISTLV